MTTDDLHRILSSNDLIEPSSGFASSVMDAVYRQATEPPPLPFPWIRFATGIAACVVLAATGAAAISKFEVTFASMVAPLAPIAPQLGYAAIVSIASLAVAYIPRLLSRLST